MFKLVKGKASGVKYIVFGLMKTGFAAVSGLITLRWLAPSEIGLWQSIMVFVGYSHLLTLGVTSGVNRELPYWMGKGEEQTAIIRLSAGGFFTTTLSLSIIALSFLTILILWLIGSVSGEFSLILFLAIAGGVLSMQTNFLGATYRSSQSFNQLGNFQLLIGIMFLLLIPLVYFFSFWGYVWGQSFILLFSFVIYYKFRPYKVKYTYNKEHTKELFKIGFPIFFWNYLSQMAQTIPRLILILFGNLTLVGFYSPAGSINNAMLNIPNYTNRFLLPQMAFKYGKSGSKHEVYAYSLKATWLLFFVMTLFAIMICLMIPTLFEVFFPTYMKGATAAQIAVFSGVFYSVNSLLHNSLGSIKELKYFKYIIGLRLAYNVFFTFLTYMIIKNLLIAVSIGSVLAELFNMFNYLYYLKKVAKFK